MLITEYWEVVESLRGLNTSDAQQALLDAGYTLD